jgi:hypothetical protein
MSKNPLLATLASKIVVAVTVSRERFYLDLLPLLLERNCLLSG